MEKIIPEVKDIALYREIVKNMLNPLEIIREGISNSIDAEAKNIIIRLYRNEKGDFSVEVQDDGNGMNLVEIKSFFNLGDSNKDTRNIGQKGLGTKIFFRSEVLTVMTQTGEGESLKAVMKNPWDNLLEMKMPLYELSKETIESKEHKTVVRIENYLINNPEKYFNISVLKDYIRWFTAGGSYKHLFANIVELNSYVKNIQVSPRIFIRDEIIGVEEEVSGTHQFHQPQENPNVDPSENVYKRSVNYCRHFGPFHKSTNINGEYVSFQLYATVLGINCRRSLARLRIGEKYKTRFGCYLTKDFIPVAKYNILLPHDKAHHFQLLLNSQNFDLTADRNNVSNMQDEKVKWILENAKAIIESEILPVAQASYFRMRKLEEHEHYKETIKSKSFALENPATKELNDLNVDDICLEKQPHNAFTTLFLLIALLSHKVYKRYIKEIRKIVFYGNDLVYKIRCQSKDDKIIIVAIEHKLSALLNSTMLKGIDCIVCWKVDVEVNSFSSGINILESDGKYKINLENERVIDVLELSRIVDIIRLEE